jgi:hypothetical protein
MEVYKQKMNNAIAKRARFSIRKRGNYCIIRKRHDWKGTIFGQSGCCAKNKNNEIILRRNKQKEMTEQKYDLLHVVQSYIVCSVYTTTSLIEGQH